MNFNNETSSILLAISSIHKRTTQRWFDDDNMEAKSISDHMLVSFKSIIRDAECAVARIEDRLEREAGQSVVEQVKQRGQFNVEL